MNKGLIELRDRIRYSRLTTWLFAVRSLCLSLVRRRRKDRLQDLANAYRARLSLGSGGILEKRLVPTLENGDGDGGNAWFRERIGWDRYEVPSSENGSILLNRSLILKEPVGETEKGVLMVWFELNLVALLGCERVRDILRRYEIVFASSWSPPYPQAHWPLAGFPEADVTLMISNPKDSAWFERMGGRFEVVPLYMSSWVDPGMHASTPIAEKGIDILMVANWAPFKRHWLLFKALRELPADWKVALIGQPESGYTVDSIRALAESYGVRQQIDYHDRMGIREVSKMQSQAKVSLILSRREGACVVVAESMFADTPVGLLEGAHVGSSAFITDETGVFLREDALAEDIGSFVRNAVEGKFTPRRWAMEHISCERSLEALNAALCRRATREAREWTKDIAAFCVRGSPEYVDPSGWAEFACCYRDFAAEYGVEFKRPGGGTATEAVR